VTAPLTVLVGIYSPFPSWNIPVSAVERLRGDFPQHRFLHATSDERTLELIPSADIAFMSEMRAPQFAAAPRLRWVHSPAAGVGGMLFPAMIESPVVMSNSRGISADTIAEHVIAVTLARFRKLSLAFHTQSARQWTQEAFVAPPSLRTIAGSTALIIGLGAIGTATARRLAAFGARVTAIRRNPDREAPEGIEIVAPPERLLDLLPAADIVVIAAPQTRHTSSLIGAAELGALRPDALLVNVSRGKLVDEAALVAALIARPTLGAALDVFEHEPLPPDSLLWALPNVLVTPHIAGFRPDHWRLVTDLFADNIRRFESGQPLHNVVNKEAGY
jgi:phosphoglycerate dehydrogenase-like enzyme